MNEKTEALMVREREADYVARFNWYYGGAAPYPPSWIEDEGLLLLWHWTTKEHKLRTRRNKETKKRETFDEVIDVVHEGMCPLASLHLELNLFSGRV